MRKQKLRAINITIILILVVGISVILGFTLVQMGVFYKEPQVETKAKYKKEDTPVLKIATDYDFCPNSYFNSDNELSGLYIEVVTEVANRLKMNPVFYTDDWIGCREKLEKKDVDVLLGLEIFSNMEGTLRTIPICSDELCVYSKKKVNSAAALSGKRVALMARSVIISTFDLQCEYVEYYTNTEILEAVEKGEVDYGICHAAVSKKIIEKNNFHLKKGMTIMKSYPAMAVQDTNPKLQKDLNRVLQEMAEDGTLYELKTKWIDEFTKDRSLNHVLQTNKAFYVTSVISIILLLAMVLVFKNSIKKQNKHIETLLDYQEKLQISNDEARRANHAKTEFLSHMSHDIRTPINGIIGMVGVIRKNSADKEKVLECSDKIDRTSKHLLSLMSDVLDMSKLESGNVELEHVPFSLDEELKSICTIIEVQANEKGIEFIVDKQIEQSRLVGSPVHFRRVLINLCSNALKYTSPNGKICIKVQGKVKEQEEMIEIMVQDNGIGMSKDFIENSLYKPFTQENGEVRTKYQGTGLGMAITYELVELMNGTIEVESELGKGTTFFVQIPFEIDLEKTEQINEKSDTSDVRGMHVLLVEDNELNREIAEFMLEEEGVLVASAENGQEAVEMFAASSKDEFDVILMDIMMPILNGIEATKQIRSLNRADATAVPIVAVTAKVFSEDRHKAMDAGMNDYLTKPLDHKKLTETLEKYKKV